MSPHRDDHPEANGDLEDRTARFPAWAGVVLVLIGHLIATVATLPSGALFLGLIQFAYVIPALVVFGILKEQPILFAIGATAGVTFILNVATCGVMMAMEA